MRGQQVHNSNTVDCSLMVFMSGNPLGGILSCRNQNHCSTQQATNLTQATLQWAHRYSKNAVEKYYIDPQMFSFLTVAPENLQILPILPAQTCPDQVFRTESSLPWPLAETSPPKARLLEATWKTCRQNAKHWHLNGFQLFQIFLLDVGGDTVNPAMLKTEEPRDACQPMKKIS